MGVDRLARPPQGLTLGRPLHTFRATQEPAPTMGPIEHALIAAAYRLANGTIPEEHRRPVDPTFDCMTQALEETCQLYGLSENTTARFLMSFALRIARLNPEIGQRRQLRDVEHQLMQACGLLGDPASDQP